MISRDESEDFFNSHLKSALEEVETLRTHILEKGKRHKLLLSGFGILACLYSYTEVQAWADTPMQKFCLSALIIIFLLGGYLSVQPELFLPKSNRNRLYNLYKNDIVREVVRFINTSFSYQPIFKTNLRRFENSQLFYSKVSEYREYYGIVGRLVDIEVKISEVQLRNLLSSSFDGWFISIDKPFNMPNFIALTSPETASKLQEKYNMHLRDQQGLSILFPTPTPVIDAKQQIILSLLKAHAPLIAHQIRVSVLDNKLSIAISNNRQLFQVSFRDENQNYIGSYMDFNELVDVTNFVESLIQAFHETN